MRTIFSLPDSKCFHRCRIACFNRRYFSYFSNLIRLHRFFASSRVASRFLAGSAWNSMAFIRNSNV